jgi:hypothetical protein
MKTAAVAALALGILALGCDEGHSLTFIALDGDFAGFRGWRRVPLGDAPLVGHPPGPRFGYVSRDAGKGAMAYPLGTIIVKTVEPTAAPETWELFAMAKRGGGFNAEGARDWEFFRLRWVAGAPHILSRGLNAIDPEADGGGGYTGNLGDVFAGLCNGCHGTKASAATDHVLSPALAPGRS